MTSISELFTILVGLHRLNINTKDENNLYIFQRQVPRKIFGPVNIDSIWKIGNKMEIDKLTEGADIVRFIKVHRIKWLENIQRMDEVRPTGKLLDSKPMGTRPGGRPRQRWQEDVMEGLKKLKVKKKKNWKERAKDRRTWTAWLGRRKPTKGCSAR